MRTTNSKDESVIQHDAELAGIDALDFPIPPAPTRARRIWSAAWRRCGGRSVAR